MSSGTRSRSRIRWCSRSRTPTLWRIGACRTTRCSSTSARTIASTPTTKGGRKSVSTDHARTGATSLALDAADGGSQLRAKCGPAVRLHRTRCVRLDRQPADGRIRARRREDRSQSDGGSGSAALRWRPGRCAQHLDRDGGGPGSRRRTARSVSRCAPVRLTATDARIAAVATLEPRPCRRRLRGVGAGSARCRDRRIVVADDGRRSIADLRRSAGANVGDGDPSSRDGSGEAAGELRSALRRQPPHETSHDSRFESRACDRMQSRGFPTSRANADHDRRSSRRHRNEETRDDGRAIRARRSHR